MATIIVEDGTIVDGANSYGSRADLITYAADRGTTVTNDTTADVALIIGMDWLETQSFPGIKSTADQDTQWPRSNAVIDGYAVDDDVVPLLVVETQFEAAIAYLAGYNPLGVQDRLVKKVQVGSLSKEYADGGVSSPMPKALYNKLAKITSGGYGGFEFRVGIG